MPEAYAFWYRKKGRKTGAASVPFPLEPFDTSRWKLRRQTDSQRNKLWAALCQSARILLVVDEVQSGAGRTDKW